ncbi:hypothetical protein M9M90_13585 [Phenylobacterium sp. LH3H17]|uniref:hypothetical protein n=1 Tax=Phenylobacterium sp. LH3H17 TaxID=2903901 RepID=UPI0020C9B2C8|nr:hypothetical protein [Phenylobacterium sp. LH3H17]UTP38247.1 hypothetical protein M9M90_13585 [Phenylobacterium sp. LH3H17]
MNAVQLAQLSCGGFFLTGLVTGVWKYRAMITDANGQAPTYVDICHRAALTYAFACLVLAEFARLSAWPPTVNIIAVAVTVLFFAGAVASYAVHGVLRDTDNQLRRPHQLGGRHLHGGLVSASVYTLAVGEIGGFLVLLTGFLHGMLR